MKYPTEITSEFYMIEDMVLPISVHRPKIKTRRSEIAIIATHSGEYIMNFSPVKELAKQGFVTAGMPLGRRSYKENMLAIDKYVRFMRSYPGIKKVILFGHSQGGCFTSSYQYLAENGTGRFAATDRIVPFPEFPKLMPADGLMLIDANHGIMDFLGIDPSVKDFRNGMERIPELDPFNPDNGYVPGATKYNREFVKRFNTAKVKYYKELLAWCQQRKEDMRLGKGNFIDNDILVLAGSGQNHAYNKLYIQDNTLLGHTRSARPLLHPDGSVTNEIIYTCRERNDPIRSEHYSGAWITTIDAFLDGELQFDGEFNFDECNLWGLDQNFNRLSTRANVKGIHVPLLCQGNQGNHEFVNIDLTFDEAVSDDKTIIMVEGSGHGFEEMTNYEKFPGQFANPAAYFAAYAAGWLAKPGRFLDDIE